MKLKSLVFGGLLTLISSFSLAQGIAPKYSNEFLQIGVGAQALGLSNSVVAGVDDVTSGYWNPAGLTANDKWLQVGAMHSEYFAGIAKYDYVGISYRIDQMSNVGFTFLRFGVDNIPNTTQLIDSEGNINYDNITTFTAADYGFLFSYARKLKVPGLRVGGTFKLIYRHAGNFAKSWGFGLDAGIQYEMKKHWKFGAMLRDVTSTFNAWIFDLSDEMKQSFIQNDNELPSNGLELTLPRLILGAQGKFDLGKKKKFYIMTEIDLDLTFDGKRNSLIASKGINIDPHIGLEIGFMKYVALRAGIGNFQYTQDFSGKKRFNLQPNIGLGVGFKGVHIDYAFTDIGNASVALYSHVFSLKFSIKKPQKNKDKPEK